MRPLMVRLGGQYLCKDGIGATKPLLRRLVKGGLVHGNSLG